MKFLKGILFILVGFTLLGAFCFIAWRYWDFFNDEGWSEWKTIGNQSYRSRVEGGNMWYLLLLFFPFAVASFFSFKQVWELWEDWLSSRISKIFFGLCLLLLVALGAFLWVAGFVDVVESLDNNIIGIAGYVLIPGTILYHMFMASIALLFNKKKK